MVDKIVHEALEFSEPERIKLHEKYLKCIPGGYGEGDTCAGIRNPHLRALSKKHKSITLAEATQLLTHKIHEIRLLALFILDLKFKSKKNTEAEKKEIVAIYLDNLHYVNNWDLVDSSAHHILGAWVFNKDYDILVTLATHENLWNNRVAIIATFFHIREKSYAVPIEIAEILLHHPHDIIHKAVGWMLREIGNRNLELELIFLETLQNNAPHYA